MKQSLLVVLALLAVLLTGCSGEKYGAGVDPKAPVVPVKDLFLQPQYLGKQVTVEGNIVSQCQSNGCWFFLNDGTGQIYIDLAQNQFTLPSLPGKRAAASGVVTRSQQNFYLVATGVEVK